MPDARDALLAGDLTFVGDDVLGEWVVAQRWFGSKAREVSALHIMEAVPLRDEVPLLSAALVEARFQPGTHEVYQLLVGLRPAEEGWDRGVIAQVDGWTAYDALTDPDAARELLTLMRESRSIRFEEAVEDFRWVQEGAPAAVPGREVRAMGAEQSNTSIVFDEALVLKTYRRVAPGINPELEIVRFLTERGFPHIAPLAGWYEHTGRLLDATLGVLQEFLPGSRDGWDIALEDLTEGGGAFEARARELGTVTGELHAALASDPGDPAFAPEEPSMENLSLLTATIDEEIEAVFLDLPADDERIAPIVGRGEDVREQLRLLTHIGAAGKVIRHHGDYHLGQCLLTRRGWVVLDFEGEPARSVRERRQKRSPLRDVAGMLRSFAYAASASDLMRGVPAPDDWEDRMREAFIDGYVTATDPSLLPPGQQAFEQLLAVFELEKAVYELRYEMNNRPDWVKIPVRGIVRLLDEGFGGA